MKIIQIAPFEEPVPPRKYGGAELVISNLTEGLLKKGHQVYLFASGDSKTKADLVSVFPKAIRQNKKTSDFKFRESLKYLGLGKTIKLISSIKADVVHNHIGWRLLPFLDLISQPVVTTLHGPLDPLYQQLIFKKFKKHPLISISDSQRVPLPGLNYLATVYNGIDISSFEFKSSRGKYLAFLGRMSPEKGPKEAILAAKKSGFLLKMAAKVDTVDKEYFKKEIKPLIDGKQIQYLGEIGPSQKNSFLKNALALLAPIQWREPFGLFMVEAQACGTPVIGFDRGSVKEVVKDKKTGFVVKNVDEMTKAIKKIDKIKRSECRKWVEKKFASKKMVDEYEKIYYQLLK